MIELNNTNNNETVTRYNSQGKPYVKCTCIICGKTFETINPKQALVCSPECKKIRKAQTHKAYIQAKRPSILHEVTCAICGTIFTTHNPKQVKYCSDKCKAEAKTLVTRQWREKQQEKFYTQNSDLDYRTCAICGYKCTDLMPHISLHHKMSIDDYCKQYNVSRHDLMTDSVHVTRSVAQETCTHENKYRFTSDNNPGLNHGGKLSPFSKNFIKYDNLNEDEKNELITEVVQKASQTKADMCTNTCTVDYYKQWYGVDDETAQQMLQERQATFSLEKCIEKYGEEEGRKRWADRQEKWLSNYKKQNYSNISQELFKRLDNQLKCFNLSMFYATNGEEGHNNEYHIRINDQVICPDFYIDDIKLIIEFDGSYWHNPEKFASVVENDLFKTQLLEANGYTVIRVKENDYRKNPIKEYSTCLTLILQKIAVMHNQKAE